MTNTLVSTTTQLTVAEPAITRPGTSAEAHDWRTAGEAWGHAATDWSCLFEHYAVEVVTAMSQATEVGSGTRLLDVACGSGWALRRAAAIGADVAGIDAAERLVDVARERIPEARIVHGSMFDLPWADESFDVVTSVNGIWGGCDEAMTEAYRVLRPGGSIAISFWGKGEPLDLRPFLVAVAAHLDPAHVEGMVSINNIAKPGVAEDMLTAAGFEMSERGRRLSVLEWPDEEIAWRALRSIGPIVPALENSDPEVVRRDAMSALAHCRDERGAYRFQNVHDYVIAHKPG